MYTEKEMQLLSLLKKNPYSSQQELAAQLELSRPSIANLISGLTKAGAIKGRAYVLSESNAVLVFGGMNIDRKMIVKNELVFQTSNPVTSYQTAGGVARNIAENLGRLGHDVKLLSAAGKDLEWEFLYEKTHEWADLEYSLRSENERTGTYTAILDQTGEMQLALADMEIYELLTAEWVVSHEKLFRTASLVVIDLNVKQEAIQAILQLSSRYSVPVAIVPVSAPKMKNLPESPLTAEWIICNKGEAEITTGIVIDSDEQLERAHKALQARGFSQTVITDGGNGISASEAGTLVKMQAIPVHEIKDVTGAGDSFVAATLHMWLQTKDSVSSLKAGLMNASKTLESTYTVRPELTAERLKLETEELT
ncbi:PfkB family carbohydrate kinase [Chryseomicrobium sp. FSL W7-1435]|uniref:PfkB family carbohydrate kinase n=1 Tax=Chryseomicrobium sp. FSL W7-1435 TaxID=2921704 RepID=UPI00315A9A35